MSAADEADPSPALVRHDDDGRALFERHPGLADRLGHVAIATLPTPVAPLELDGLADGTRVWIKRDDLSGEPYGGNKVRKLEFLLADAITRGCSRVWTVGAIGSNHCLATALYARRVGLGVQVLHFPQPVTGHVRRNLRAIAATGAELVLASRNTLPAEVARRHVRDWLTKRSERDYYIPAGGSSPVGVLGYVNAALELVAQVERGELPRPRTIYVAAGTCGTLSGLEAGFWLAGWHELRLIGVRVVDRMLSNPRTVRRLVAGALGLLADHGVALPTTPRPHVTLDHQHYGAGYGHPTDEALAAIARLRTVAGVPALEPTYTAKAMAALLGDLARGRARGDVLYWHTLSSRPLDALVDASPPEALPEPYRRFFEGPTEA